MKHDAVIVMLLCFACGADIRAQDYRVYLRAAAGLLERPAPVVGAEFALSRRLSLLGEWEYQHVLPASAPEQRNTFVTAAAKFSLVTSGRAYPSFLLGIGTTHQRRRDDQGIWILDKHGAVAFVGGGLTVRIVGRLRTFGEARIGLSSIEGDLGEAPALARIGCQLDAW